MLGWFVATESVVDLKRDDSVDSVVVTNASCELRKPPLVYDAPSSVWRLVCDQAGVVKLTDDIKQAVAVFSDCKRQGLWLRGSIPVVLFWRLICNRLELSRRLVAVCRDAVISDYKLFGLFCEAQFRSSSCLATEVHSK